MLANFGRKHFFLKSKLKQNILRIPHRPFSAAKITAPAPAFSGMAWTDQSIKQLSLSDYSGQYVVLFFYALDFTWVCPTEICAFNDLNE